ncbi:phosphotransferase family protein [Nocardioides sp. zg-DK7169]|uniref:phosphotransferase family protein n=1 Tax=Nocardioides sp. zg-DK7169 TaxID=2736600 RepID=UPI001552989D|nr:phosphotransferase family protein [Nocardioides sp. zg-DK7169]NPC96675.1 phosphotransferase family protein [Nocardioides sp. zg-DK7169]
MTEAAASPRVEMTIKTTDTDLDEVRRRLTRWLAEQLDADEEPEVSNLRRPEHSGMSSISMLFDLSWRTGGEQHRAVLVARMVPVADAFPVFPSYDVAHQFEVMRTVAERSAVPVPRVRWVEASGEALGAPFMVMDQVSGAVPADNPPYVFTGWLLEMGQAEQRAIQDASVRVLADIHAIESPATGLSAPSTAGSSLRAHFENERAYYEWTRREDGLRIPCLERAFEWLEAWWPAEPSPDVLCWGDSRIGNIMYDGTDVAAVLDWESAVLAPRELDLGWFLFFHRQFQDLAEVFEMPGLPHLFRRDDVVAAYEQAAGVEVRDLDWFIVYAALRHGIVMGQIHRRRMHFGEVEAPAHPDGYVLHHAMLGALLDGTYSWER